MKSTGHFLIELEFIMPLHLSCRHFGVRLNVWGAKGKTMKSISALLLFMLILPSHKAFSEECGFEKIYLNPFTPMRTAQVYIQNNPRMSLNDEGVLVFDYGSAYDNVGEVANPLFVATYALSLFEDHLIEPKFEYLDGLRIQTEFLIFSAQEREFGGIKFYVWTYPFPTEKFSAKPGWVSSLAHGRILSLFSQMYKLTGEERFLEAAHLTYNSMLVPMSEGGVATYTEAGVWLEEIADTDLASIKILNGHISAVAGVWTYAKNTCSSEALQLSTRGINAVINDIDLFDLGFLSLYSVEPTDKPIFAPAGGYNHLHIRQLSWIYELSGSNQVLEVALNTALYDEPRYTLSAKSSRTGTSPENLDFTRKKYWASDELSSWVEVDLHKLRHTSKAYILANGSNSAYYPGEMRVEFATEDRNWQPVIGVNINQVNDLSVITFDQVEARYIRVHIDSAQSGGNEVRLDGIFIDTTPRPVRAISSWHDVYQKSNRPEYLFSSYYGTLADGWLIASLGDFPIFDNKLTLVYQPNNVRPGTLTAFVGDDLDSLINVNVEMKQVGKFYEYVVPIEPEQYLKLEFSGFTRGYALRLKCIKEKICKG